MTLDKFLSTPNACIICNTIEDFEFLQKIFVKKNIRWANGHEFNNFSSNLSSPKTYPVYITSNRMWGIVADTEMFSRMTTILDMEAIDDFYDERLTVEEFVNSKEKLVINVKNDQEALKLLDRLQLLGKTYANGDSYLSEKNKYEDLCHGYSNQCCYTNQGCYGSKSYFKNSGIKIYKFEDINFDITFTDFFKRSKSVNYHFEGVKVVNFKTEDEMNKFIEVMKSKGIIPPTLNGFKAYGSELCFSSISTYGDINCYHNQKESNGARNTTFAPIYTFEEIIFD